MKDIPLIIEGYFATAPAPNISCQVSLGNFVTFKCYRPDYLLEPPVISRPLNLSATPPRTRNLPIYRAASRRRIIEIYTSPAAFEILTLTNIGVRSFPETFLPNLFALNLSFNNFTKLPESLNKSTPTLQTLNISHNPLKTESPILTRDLAARLPTGLVNLSIGNTYESIEIFDDNGVQKSVFELFPLKFLDIAGLATKLTGILPSVSGSCEIYNASNNNFTSLPERGLLRPQA